MRRYDVGRVAMATAKLFLLAGIVLLFPDLHSYLAHGQRVFGLDSKNTLYAAFLCTAAVGKLFLLFVLGDLDSRQCGCLHVMACLVAILTSVGVVASLTAVCLLRTSGHQPKATTFVAVGLGAVGALASIASSALFCARAPDERTDDRSISESTERVAVYDGSRLDPNAGPLNQALV